MMYFAICDDHELFCHQLADLLQQATADDQSVTTIDLFHSGEALWSAYQENQYDLIFLDIEMGEMSGCQICMVTAQKSMLYYWQFRLCF